MNTTELTILRVAKTTDFQDLASAIMGQIINFDNAIMTAVGADACYVCTRALIETRGMSIQQGYDVTFTANYKTAETESGQITMIEFHAKKMKT